MEETSANILNVIEILQEKFVILSGKYKIIIIIIIIIMDCITFSQY
jgi:predicted metallopeptidase